MLQTSSITFHAPPLPYLLECGRSDYKPGETHPSRHNLGIFDVIVMRQGTLYIGEENSQWALRSGQILLLRPDAYHYAVKPCEEETVFYWLHVQADGQWQEVEAEGDGIQTTHHHSKPSHERDFQWYASLNYSLQLPKHGTLPHPEAVFTMLDSLLEASTEAQSSAFWHQQATFIQLLQTLDMRRFEDQISPIVSLAEQTETYLKQNYRREITNGDLAEAMNFHVNYITRCMKQVYGVTPMEYLHRHRLEQAKLLLLRTDWPIAHVAEQVGYEHAPYFTRRFSQYAGMSPRQYRQKYMQ